MADNGSGHVLLRRDLTLLGVVATAVCTVIGGGINVLTVEIQDTVPGIDGLVPLAFLLGAVPAAFTALSYAILASAMPRAGGGYIYISRGLNPFVGFIAAFSKWWGYSVACGVVAYLDVALIRAAALYAHLDALAAWLETPAARLGIPIVMVWAFWLINLLGVRVYGATVIALMLLMLSGGLIVILAGAFTTHGSFAAAMAAREGIDIWEVVSRHKPPPTTGSLSAVIQATILLFFAYIGFGSASQAGGEARNPRAVLPRAFMLSLLIIGGYYLALSWSLYHAVPWRYVAQVVLEKEAEMSLPEIMGVLLPSSLAVYVAAMAALALANDIPAMLMAASRLFFAWARDNVFPSAWAACHPTFRTPHIALTAASIFATLGVIGCHLFGPVRMGVDSVVLALLFTYTCVGIAIFVLPRRNPNLYSQIAFIRARWGQVAVAIVSTICTGSMLILQLKDSAHKLASSLSDALAQGQSLAAAWASSLASCPAFVWLTMLVVGAIIFAASWRRALAAGVDMQAVFMQLPAEAEDTEDTERWQLGRLA